MRGNVIDLAVGVVVGGAFGQIVNSLVADIIMPPIGILVGGVDFSELAFTLKPATADAAAVKINYGNFIQSCVNFLIIAFSIFLFVRLLSKIDFSKDKDTPPVAPTKDQELLGEIRDLLKQQNSDLEKQPLPKGTPQS